MRVLEAPMSASDFGHDDDSASAGLRKGVATVAWTARVVWSSFSPLGLLFRIALAREPLAWVFTGCLALRAL